MDDTERDAILKIMNAIHQANILAGLGRLDEAYDVIDVLAIAVEASPGATYLQASIAMRAGRWRDASTLLDSLLRLPAAATKLRIGEACLSLTPDRGRMRLDLARCLVEARRYGEAIAELAAEGTPDAGQILLAWIDARRNRPDLAILRLGSLRAAGEEVEAVAAGCPELAALLASIEVN